MRKVKKEDFDYIVQNLIVTKANFSIDTKRKVKSLIVNNNLFLVTKNENRIFNVKDNRESHYILNIFSQVKKNINTYIRNSDLEIEKVRQKSNPVEHNMDNWNKLKKGDMFFLIDINHCFWRIAFLRGYISESIYTKLCSPENKLYRNMALSLIVAQKTREYYKNGKITLSIEEDTTIYKIIYDNIRFTSYNLMNTAMIHAKSDFLCYKTDGIMILENSVNKICELFKKLNYKFTIDKCTKIDDKHFVTDGGDVKTF